MPSHSCWARLCTLDAQYQSRLWRYHPLKRTLYGKYELQRLQLTALIRDSKVPNHIKSECQKNLNRLPRNSSLIRVRNRCVLTGRGRSVYRFCRLSRIKVRELASQGWIQGVQKNPNTAKT